MVAGSRVLLVGLGGVGREVARQLTALNAEVWGVRRSGGDAPEHVARLVSYDAFDVVLGDVDAVFCGRQSADWDMGQVGLLVAEHLGWPVAIIAKGRRERALQ